MDRVGRGKWSEFQRIHDEYEEKMAELNRPKFFPIVARRSLLCRVGLHRPVYQSAIGYVNWLTHIERRVCPCGAYEWVYMDGFKMERQKSYHADVSVTSAVD